jgi:hypothetical protein
MLDLINVWQADLHCIYDNKPKYQFFTGNTVNYWTEVYSTHRFVI